VFMIHMRVSEVFSSDENWDKSLDQDYHVWSCRVQMPDAKVDVVVWSATVLVASGTPIKFSNIGCSDGYLKDICLRCQQKARQENKRQENVINDIQVEWLVPIHIREDEPRYLMISMHSAQMMHAWSNGVYILVLVVTTCRTSMVCQAGVKTLQPTTCKRHATSSSERQYKPCIEFLSKSS
jgi:hypothetical protein